MQYINNYNDSYGVWKRQSPMNQKSTLLIIIITTYSNIYIGVLHGTLHQLK